MQQDSAGLLEYPALIGLISRKTQSTGGRDFVNKLAPLGDASILDERRLKVEEACRLRQEGQSVSLLLDGEPTQQLEDLKVEGHALEPDQFLLFRNYLRAAQKASSMLKSADCPTLAARWRELPASGHIVQALERTFDDDGEIKDSAHPDLAETRNRKRKARQKVQRQLEKMLSKYSKALIPDAFVTQRSHRYVIPVRVESQKSVPGIMHAASSSGATVFIEPFATVDLNNECLYLEDRERELIQKILLQLSQLFREEADTLRTLVTLLSELDGLQAIARFAEEFSAILPTISEEGALELDKARHPLLVESLGTKKVVPLSLILASDQPVLVISGPNTGGKTVVLKTIGLLALAAHAGLPVPARAATFPRLEQVQADIGDHQSIAESLSTFSAHILRLKGIVENLRLPSLVLLDEIGSGTDPVYGGALGIAIVDHFRRAGARLVATTHLRSVKAYAAERPDVVNASVELNPKTLRPNYRLTLGTSGESSALEIAAQLGLPAGLLELAKEQLSDQEMQLESYLDELKLARQELEIERQLTADQRAAAQKDKARLQEEASRQRAALEKRFEKQLETIEDDYKKDVNRFLKSTKDRMEAARLRQQATKRREALRQRAREEIQKPERKATQPVESAQLEVGQEVFHRLFRKRGRVLETSGDQALLDIDGKRVASAVSQLDRIEKKEVDRRPDKTIRIQVVEDTDPELNLVGKRVNEALPLLDKFLDRAFLSELREVRIIHGFGTGRLKNAVHEMLSEHHQVASHYLDGGATIAELHD